MASLLNVLGEPIEASFFGYIGNRVGPDEGHGEGRVVKAPLHHWYGCNLMLKTNMNVLVVCVTMYSCTICHSSQTIALYLARETGLVITH